MTEPGDPDRSLRRSMSAVALIAAVLVAVLVPGWLQHVQLGADAGFTYGYLPSVVADGDLDFEDDSIPFDSIMPHTALGYTHNAFPIGPALWWAPAFLTAHGLGAAARVVTGSPDPAPDGRSWPYSTMVGLATFVVALVGLWATLAACQLVAPGRPAAIATMAMWLAGPLLFYSHVENVNSHPAGFASCALLLLAWLRFRDRPDPSLWRTAALGLLGSLVALSRWQNILLMLGPALDVAGGRWRGRRGPDVAGTSVLVGTVALGFLPQVLVWQSLYGLPLPGRGEFSGDFVDVGRLHLWDVLFGWRHGMFSWHPVLAVGVVGLVIWARRAPRLAWPLLASLAAMAIVNAAVFDWWGGVSFGGRRFDGVWPALAIGLAIVAARVPRVVAVVGAGALFVVNWLLLLAFGQEQVSRVDAVRPADLVAALGRLRPAAGLADWSARKMVWVAALALAAVVPLWRARRPRPLRLSSAGLVILGLSAVVVTAGAVANAARQPGHYDAATFEAGFFVPQPGKPASTDRVVSEADDVWTVVYPVPGFLPPGRYVATALDVRSETATPARLEVRVDGRTVTAGPVGSQRSTLRGQPFELPDAFLVRLDLHVTGGPVRIEAVRLTPWADP